MKKTLILMTCVALLLTLIACGGTGKTAGENESNEPENIEKPGDTMTLEEIFTDILDGVEGLPASDNITVTAQNFVNYLFIDNVEGSEALASEALINAIAHSAVLLRVSEDADVQAIADEIEANADPRKWICVEAEKTIVRTHGRIILLVMSGSDAADAIAANFDALWE